MFNLKNEPAEIFHQCPDHAGGRAPFLPALGWNGGWAPQGRDDKYGKDKVRKMKIRSLIPAKLGEVGKEKANVKGSWVLKQQHHYCYQGSKRLDLRSSCLNEFFLNVKEPSCMNLSQFFFGLHVKKIAIKSVYLF